MAMAQQDANSRLNRLENEIQTLSRAVFKGEAPPPGAALPGSGGIGGAAQAAMETRLSQIENDVRMLTGRVEQMDYDLRQLQQNLEMTLRNMDLRLAGVEQRMVSAAAPAPQMQKPFQPPPQQQRAMPLMPQDGGAGPDEEGYYSAEAEWGGMPPAPQATEQAPPRMAGAGAPMGTLSQKPDGSYGADATTPAGAYEAAFALLRNQDYEGAEKSFTAFIGKYPDDKLIANAKYWLGETFYVRNNFERAARVFAEAYQQFPKGPKGPDNLLKLALSLAGMNKKEDACLTLQQLKREYPSGAGPVLARADREAVNLGCK